MLCYDTGLPCKRFAHCAPHTSHLSTRASHSSPHAPQAALQLVAGMLEVGHVPRENWQKEFLELVGPALSVLDHAADQQLQVKVVTT